MNKVSIITVVLNGVKTIEKTIQSVLSQDYPDVEYIIIDGESTDGTMDIVDRYRDKIAIVVSEPDQGLYDAMNKGIGLSSGHIIGIINSDDWYENDAIERAVFALEKHEELDIVYGDMMYVEPDEQPYLYEPPEFRTLWRLMPVNHPATFVRREVYEKYGRYDISYRIAGDCEAMLRFWMNKLRFGHINYVISNFRVGGVSCIQRKQNESEVKSIVEQYVNDTILMDSFAECTRDKKEPLFLWGAGRWGTFLAKHLIGQGLNIKGIYDIDRNLWGEERHSVKIIPPYEAGRYKQTIVVAINKDEIDVSKYISPEKIANCTIVHIKKVFEKYECSLAKKYGDVVEIE